MTDRFPQPSAKPAAIPAAIPVAIDVQHLTKSYGPRDLTFTVPRGAICGFLGPNGAGKTTTMRILMGLARSRSGTAAMLGVPALDAPDRRQYRLCEAPTACSARIDPERESKVVEPALDDIELREQVRPIGGVAQRPGLIDDTNRRFLGC